MSVKDGTLYKRIKDMAEDVIKASERAYEAKDYEDIGVICGDIEDMADEIEFLGAMAQMALDIAGIDFELLYPAIEGIVLEDLKK